VFKVTKRPKNNAAGEQSPAVSFVLDAGDVVPVRRPHDGFQISKPEPETNQVLNHYQAKKARAAAKQYVENSRAQYASPKQIGYLANLLDHPGKRGMEAYVRFANAYHLGTLTRVHFKEAIDLAIRGYNSWGTYEDLTLLAMLEGPLWTGEGAPSSRPKRAKGSSRNRASGSRRKV
jgi:hypothetical protein